LGKEEAHGVQRRQVRGPISNKRKNHEASYTIHGHRLTLTKKKQVPWRPPDLKHVLERTHRDDDWEGEQHLGIPNA